MTLSYKDLTITVWAMTSKAILYPNDCACPAEYDDYETNVDWDYEADDREVSEKLFDLLRDTDDCQNMSNEELDNYISEHFGELVEEYNSELLERFKDQAREDAEENYEPEPPEPPEPDYDDYRNYYL